jgi:hypothetical protein
MLNNVRMCMISIDLFCEKVIVIIGRKCWYKDELVTSFGYLFISISEILV